MEELLREMITEDLYQVIISNPKNQNKGSKVKIRPVMLKNKLYFQKTLYIGTQVFHENLEKEALLTNIMTYMSESFHQCEIESAGGKATILVSKKGKVTIKRKVSTGERKTIDLSHNRVKSYILEEGVVVPFLMDLGVQAADGKISVLNMISLSKSTVFWNLLQIFCLHFLQIDPSVS